MNHRVRACALTVGVVVASVVSGHGQTPAAPAPKTIVVKAARLIDGTGAEPISHPVVVIQGDRITQVGAGLATPAGAEVIDLGAATLLPGFIDCHTHVTGQPGENFYVDLFKRSPIDSAVMSHVYAWRTLEAGFTTIRNVGAEEYVDIALRNAIERGDVAGPRMRVSGLAAERDRRPRRSQRLFAVPVVQDVQRHRRRHRRRSARSCG